MIPAMKICSRRSRACLKSSLSRDEILRKKSIQTEVSTRICKPCLSHLFQVSLPVDPALQIQYPFGFLPSNKLAQSEMDELLLGFLFEKSHALSDQLLIQLNICPVHRLLPVSIHKNTTFLCIRARATRGVT